MSKAVKLVPGRRHPARDRIHGHPPLGVRTVWYERRCPQCGAITRGDMDHIPICVGGAEDAITQKRTG